MKEFMFCDYDNAVIYADSYRKCDYCGRKLHKLNLFWKVYSEILGVIRKLKFWWKWKR